MLSLMRARSRANAGFMDMRILCAALSAGFLSVAAPHSAAEEAPKRTLETVLAELAGGGSVILMRHANSPSGQGSSVGMTEGCELDAEGFFQARFIGDFLKSESAPITAAFTSDMCRTWDTARLVAAGTPVMASEALRTTDVIIIENFKQIISSSLAGNPKGNILLVTHSNIVPLYAGWGSDDEIPSGVILIVDPADWTVRDKINLDIDLTVD